MHEPETPERDRYQRAYRMLIEGKYKHAMREYRVLCENNPSNELWRLEQACALAGANEIREAESLLSTLDSDAMSDPERSRYLTAKAWISAQQSQEQEARQYLAEAVARDPSFPPPHIALARFYAFGQHDFDQARAHLQTVVSHEEINVSLALHEIAIEMEAKDYIEASRITRRHLRRFRYPPKLLLATLLSLILKTPRQGFIAIILFALLSFIPILGPLLYIGSTLLAIGYFALLRRISARFLAYPITYWLSITGIYIGRVILWGRVFP